MFVTEELFRSEGTAGFGKAGYRSVGMRYGMTRHTRPNTCRFRIKFSIRPLTDGGRLARYRISKESPALIICLRFRLRTDRVEASVMRIAIEIGRGE